LELHRAYETLSDSESRKEYDRERKRRRKAHISQTPFYEQEREEGFSARAKRFAGTYHDLEIVLSPEEADWGGVIPLALPTRKECPICSGFDFFRNMCPFCSGTGTIRAESKMKLHIPPGVRDGTEFFLDEIGLSGLIIVR
jgi:DnaJ-class molecular chaperone